MSRGAPQAAEPIGRCCGWRQDKCQHTCWLVKLLRGQRAALPTSAGRSPEKLEIPLAALWRVLWFLCSVKTAAELPKVQSHLDRQPLPQKVPGVQRTELDSHWCPIQEGSSAFALSAATLDHLQKLWSYSNNAFSYIYPHQITVGALLDLPFQPPSTSFYPDIM